MVTLIVVSVSCDGLKLRWLGNINRLGMLYHNLLSGRELSLLLLVLLAGEQGLCGLLLRLLLAILQLIVRYERYAINRELRLVVVAVTVQHVLDKHALVWHERSEYFDAGQVVQL